MLSLTAVYFSVGQLMDNVSVICVVFCDNLKQCFYYNIYFVIFLTKIS